MTTEERTNYKIGVQELRQMRTVRADFQVKLKEATQAYWVEYAHYEDCMKGMACLPRTVEEISHACLDEYLTKLLQDSDKEVRRWKNLLATPKDDGTLESAKRVPIEDLYQFEKVSRSGGTFKALCPFHEEKNPSFVIYLKDNHWWCFGGCARGGDSIDFVRLRDNVGTHAAINILNGI